MDDACNIEVGIKKTAVRGYLKVSTHVGLLDI